MSARLVVEQLFNGLVLGSMYALMASGLSLIWGSLKVLNFAHGEFYMLGGYAVFFFFVMLGLPAALAVPLAMVAVMIVGVAAERLIINPLMSRSGWEISTIIATLGLSIFLQNFALRIWGERFKNVPYYANGTLMVGDIRIAEQRLIILITAVLVILVGAALLKFTRLGMALRATAQDTEGAILMGINTRGIYTWTVAISAALAALAAAMLSPIFSVNPWMGLSLLLKAFIVCVLGGLGNLEGAILGGILLGLAESLTVVFWSSEWQDLTAFVLFLLVLWFRPSGLISTREW